MLRANLPSGCEHQTQLGARGPNENQRI